MEQDVDQVRWRKNGLGAYVWGGAASVKNFLMYIDDVIHWRTTFSDSIFEPLGSKPNITVHVPADYLLELLATEDELKCVSEVKREASGKLTVFDVPPPTFPARCVALTFDVVSPTSHTREVSFVGTTTYPATNRSVRRVGRPKKEWVPSLQRELCRVSGNLNTADQICADTKRWRAYVHEHF